MTQPVRRDRKVRSGSGSTKIQRVETRRMSRGIRWTKERWQRLLAVDGLWVLLFLALSTAVLAPSAGDWKSGGASAGSIAQRDFVAPEDALIPDVETTNEKRNKARADVLPVWDFDPDAAARVDGQLAQAFSIGRQLVVPATGTEDPPEGAAPLEPLANDELVDAIRAGSNLELSLAQVKLLRNRKFDSGLEDRLRGVYELVLRQGVVAGKGALLENRTRGIRVRDLGSGTETLQLDLYGYAAYPGEVRDLVQGELRGWIDFRTEERSLLTDFIVTNTSPNLHPNPSETLGRQMQAAESVEQVYNRVLAGQVIVRKGDEINGRAAEIIRELSSDLSLAAHILPILGTALLLGLLVVLIWLGVRRDEGGRTARGTMFSETLILFAVTLVCAKICYLLVNGLAASVSNSPFNLREAYFYAIPFAALPLLMVLAYGRSLAVLVTLALAVVSPMVVESSSWSMVLFSLAGSLAAILFVDHYQLKQRSLLVRTGLAVSLVNVVSVLVLAALRGEIEGGGGASQVAFEAFCGFAGGILVAAVVSFAVPVLESVFSVTTGMKLVELANTNLPLLRRVAFEAPGTFQHSLMVANLSKSGCEAIGADSVLAYTGALYHDIGKIFRPEYFVENQRPGQNRHDKIQPSMSALIIINHVKEGLELAREYHLPQPILDAIAQHHGTRLISYFYNRAKDQNSPESGEVPEDKYRYPGPKPQGKVMGVLMLADGVEAASRTLVDPDPVRLRSVIKAITDDCLRDGQLDETDLTLGDLNRVAEAFLLVLTHIHHRRLDYPGFDFKGKPAKTRENGERQGNERKSGEVATVILEETEVVEETDGKKTDGEKTDDKRHPDEVLVQ
ncbi:MAG: HDIG domain-containing protein [Thermoanaerobaculia bacterium]|nr:HDIG domain-containing protein [Thermoanaerobaculia bacterium]